MPPYFFINLCLILRLVFVQWQHCDICY